MHISRLNIDIYKSSTELLIKLLPGLPNIDLLRISSFSMDFSNFICFTETKDFYFVSNKNNITKVCLGQMDKLKLNHFVFMNLSHRVQYLEKICTKDVNIEMFIRLIVKKYTIYIPHLRSLCLCITNLNDKMVKQLDRIIDYQKLLHEYIIKHSNNKLYFQWKYHKTL
jgi:hypothetical protein